MSPRFAARGLSALFGPSSGRSARRTGLRQAALRHERRRFIPLAESLEPRQLLAVFYRGVQQSVTTSAAESFQYVVDVDASGTGELWIRYEALRDRIDIADNPGFGGVDGFVQPRRPGFFGPATVPQNVPAPFSLEGVITVPQVAWNVAGQLEDFSSGALTINAAPGTRVFVANGDPLPLAFRVFPVNFGNAASAALVDIGGPINATLNPATSSPVVYDTWFYADTISTRAAMTTGNTTRLYANNLIDLQNVVTSPLTEGFVGKGDFRLIAGAKIAGDLSVYLGQTGSSGFLSPIGFGTPGRPEGGNILIDGTVAANSSVTLQTNSAIQPVNIKTGPSGQISGPQNLTLFNSGPDGGSIDVRAAGFSVTNINTGATSGPVRDIGISVDQTAGNLRIAAVPRSRGQISLKASAAGSTITIDSNVDTDAGLALEAATLSVNRPLQTAAGNIVLTGDQVTVGSNVTAGANGVGAIRVRSRTGKVTLSSAAVLSAIDETITVEAATDIDSQARLAANLLDLTAGGGISLKSNANEVRATAGGGIAISDNDSLLVRSAVAGNGDIAISALGALEVATATVQKSGGLSLDAGAGLLVGVARTTAGPVSLSAQAGDVRVVGTVAVGGGTNGLTVSSGKGDVVVESSAAVTVPGAIAFSAPVGRVLTPGSVSKVIVENPGSGYTQAPQVVFPVAAIAAASAVVGRSDQVAGITLAAGGSGYVGPVTVTISPPAAGVQATAVASLVAGVITGITITQQGSGYSSSNPPTVSFAGAGGSGSGAVAVAVVGSKVSGLQVVAGGTGYVTAPTVALVGGGGRDATARAFVTNGVVTSLQVTNPGTGYTSAPSVVFSGGSGSGAVAQAQIGGVTSVVVNNPGSGYLVPPQVVISSGDGGSAGAISVNSTGGITGINLATPGADYGVAPLVEIIDSTGTGSGAAAVAELASGVGTFSLTNGGSNYPAAPAVTVAPPPAGPTSRPAVVEAAIAGFVQSISAVTIGGTGYSPNVQAAFVGGGGVGASAAVTINGSLSSDPIPVTVGGAGYSAVPSVGMRAPDLPGGVQAEAVALLGLTSASVFLTYDPPTLANPNPTRYSAPPSITFATPAGGQAAIGRIDLDASGQAVGVTILDPGFGYTTLVNANVTISGGVLLGNPGRGLTLTANSANFTVSRINRTVAGSGYSADVDLTFSGGGGSGTVARAEVRGPIAAAVLVAPGSGYTAPPQVQFLDAFGVGASALTTALNATVTSLRIVDPGAGYVTAPAITIAPPPAGTQAAATLGLTNVVSRIVTTAAGQNYDPATTSVRLTPVAGGNGATSAAVSVDASGRITRINLGSGGSDYSAPPTVTITDTSGSGREALATAIVAGGRITGFTIASPGIGYNPQTTFVTLTAAGSGATGVANLDALGRIASITVTNSGSGYRDGAGAPVVRIVEYGAGAQATAAVAGGQVTGVTIPPGGGGANYAVAPLVQFVGGGATVPATGKAVIGGIAAISGGSLSWTAANGPLDAVLDTFSQVAINLTAPGNLVLARNQGALTLLGATTKDGSISISAPSLTVAGPVRVGNFSGQPNLSISLSAAAGDLRIDAPVGDLVQGATTPTPVAKAVILRADNGSITATNPAAAGLVTGTALEVRALSGITVRTNVASVRGAATSNAANVTVTQTFKNADGNVFPLVVGTADGPLATSNGIITVTAGSIVQVGSIDAQPNGSVVISATSIDELPVDVGTVDLRAAAATLSASEGRIVLDTALATVTASAPQATLEIRNVSGAALAATLSSRNGVTLSNDGTITATNVTAVNGGVALTAIGAASDISIGTITATGFPVRLAAGRSILQVDPSKASITGGSADLTATAGTLDLLLATESATALAPGAISLRNTGPMQILRAESTSGQPVTLTAAGVLSQSGPIRTTGLLSVTGNGVSDIVLRAVDNQVGSFTGKNPGAGIAFRSGTALAVAAAGVSGGAIELVAGGELTQQGPIAATVSLDASATAGAVRLDRVDNAFPVLTGRTFNGGFTVIGAGGFSVGTAGVVAGTEAQVAGNGSIALTALAGGITLVGDLTAVLDTITLQAAAGTVTQTATSKITAATLRLTTATPAVLIAGNNTIGNIIEDLGGNIVVGVAGQPITVPDLFTATGNITILGSTVSILGAVQAAGTGTITVTASGAVTFGPGGLLTAAAVSLTAVGNSQLRVGANVPVAAATVTGGGSLALSSPGNLRQTGPIVAAALTATAGSGSILLGNAANAVGSFSASAPFTGGNIQFVNAGGFSVAAPGITAGTAAAGDGFVTLSAVTGNISVSAPITAPGDLVELRAPAGVVTLGVTPVAQTLIVIDSTGGGVPTGPIEAGNLEALLGAIDIVNSLPVSGTVYRIIVTAPLTLTRTLTFANAIALEGVPGVVIDGGGTLGQGVVIGSLAVGSRITNLAFANFTGTVVTVNAARNVAIQGLTVSNSATGLALSGVVTGTTVRGSTFRSVRVAMQLTGAQGATIGGTPTAQRNRIEGASQAGVVATGFCTGTRIVGTTFTANPRTRTQFNVKSSRGLRISGTTVERAPRVTAPSRPPVSIFGRR